MEENKETSLSALIVDDNEVNALILAKMLKIFNIFTAQTYSGKNAVRLCRKNNYDVIFIDHIMPEMNGLELTLSIRKTVKGDSKPVIFILTSVINDQIRRIYAEAGANEVFEKPLTITRLITYLKKWFPMVNSDLSCTVKKPVSPAYVNKIHQLRKIMEGINEINFESGIKYSMGNPDHFIKILTASIKDIKNFLSLQPLNIKNLSSDTYFLIRVGIHNLKSIFAYIGVFGLLEEAKYIDAVINQGDEGIIRLQLSCFINHIIEFKSKLEAAVKEYEKLWQNEITECRGEKLHPILYAEYEQCIHNAIYYIKRYEYDAIISEIEKLAHFNTEYKQEFEKALEETKEFNYEKALLRLLRITELNKELNLNFT